ncbi:Cmx/CmrA family chloramphenicol efflux MFS transporter [Saccharopolyspora sp. NPDC047091]|uniref:Cmx/CmrA family chloramphenicol efflux MFS transporter n=1 Tax=Saccharopolyspora sp. NPDC047091 TaxID=3155924 RepID=UPI0033D43776
MPLVLPLLALAMFAMGTSEFMLAGLVPDIAADLGVPIGSAGLLTSAFAAGMVVGAPAMAVLARRRSARWALLACLLVFAGCHVVGALTAAFPVLFGTRVVAALANAGFLAVALSTATRSVPADRQGRALAVLLSGTTVATVVGVPSGALLGAAFGWRAPFWVVALLCAPAALGVARGVPGGGADAAAVRLRAELAQLRVPRLTLAMGLAALVNAGTFAAFTFLAPVVTGAAGLVEWWVSPALVLFGAGSSAGVALAGRLSDRRPGVVLAVGGPVLLLGWVLLAVLAAHPVVLLVLLLAQGTAAFAVGGTLIALVLRFAAGAPVLGGAYATAALNVGAVGGPAAGAAALTTSAGELGPVLVAAALTALALLAALPRLRTLTSG